MKISKDRPVDVVGYIRLSTDKQAADDGEFQRQAQRIKRACLKRGFNLLATYEDVASGTDPLGAVRRDGLVDAVSHARQAGAVLVISEPTRLFRHVNAAEEFLEKLDIPVFSVREGRFMKKRALLGAIARGAASVENIRQGTRNALAKQIADGITFSKPDGRSEAAKASAKVRSLKADEVVFKVASALRSDQAVRALTHKELADLLNKQRIFSSWKRPWTKDSIRAVRKKAEALLSEWAENDRLDDGDQFLPESAFSGAKRDATVEHDPVQTADLDEDEIEMRKNPFYGVF